MERIFKYMLKVTDGVQEVEMPEGYEISHYGHQGVEELVFWAVIDDEAPKVKVKFRIAGTGQGLYFPLKDFWSPRTVPMPSGLVWHVFRGR